MKTLIVYASVTGNTEKLAKGIYKGLNVEDKHICNIREDVNIEEYDLIILGFWAFRGECSPDVKEFIEKIHDKKVFLFGTLGFYADSQYAHNIISKVNAYLVEGCNSVLSSYMCTGAIEPKRLADKINHPEKYKQPLSQEKRVRYEVLSKHPTETDIAVVVERFNDRIEVMRRLEAEG